MRKKVHLYVYVVQYKLSNLRHRKDAGVSKMRLQIYEDFDRRVRKMKKAKWLWIFLICCCMNMGMNVNAEAQFVTAERTEADRYNSKYNMPIFTQAGEEQLDRAGISEADFQELENVLVNAWKNYETSVNVSKFNLTVNDDAYATYYWQILSNHPEVFYVANTIGASGYGNYVQEYKIIYSMEQSEIEEMQEQMDAIVDEVLVLLSEEMEEYEKALIVHDWLVNHCQYDYANYLAGTVPESAHSAYGALVNGVAVCDGYSKAFQYIMDYKLGIDCYCISSNSMGHAWNLIEMGGNYYHVDATWDDPVNEQIISDKIGYVGHSHFLLSDTGITNANHRGWETNVAATDTTYDGVGNWQNTSGQIIYHNGKWYYVDNSAKSIVSTTNILNGETISLYSLGTWKYTSNSSWSGVFSYPQLYNNKLIFNGPKAIYSMNFSTNVVKELYVPDLTPDTTSEVYNIFGFDVKNDKLRYMVSSNANLTGSETIQEADFPSTTAIQGSVSITGTAQYGATLQADVSLTIDTTEDPLYQWYRDGELIDGAENSTYTLTKSDIGHVICVKVTLEDYSDELTAETECIQKLVANIPTEAVVVAATRCQFLSEISLPEGYSWVNPDTILTETGTKTYGIIYCPDEEIYEPVTGLMAEVIITCQSHEWDEGSIIKAATVSENGIKEYQCKYCDETKEDDIPKLDASLETGDNTGDIEDNTGNTEDTGRTEDNTGDTEDNTGDTEDNTGNVEDNTGDVENNTGDTEDNIGDVEDNTGDAEDNTGDTEDNTGDVEDNTENTDDSTGNTGDNTGDAEDNTGNTDDSTGNTEGNIGDIENNTGNADDDTENMGDDDTVNKGDDTEGTSNNTEDIEDKTTNTQDTTKDNSQNAENNSDHTTDFSENLGNTQPSQEGAQATSGTNNSSQSNTNPTEETLPVIKKGTIFIDSKTGNKYKITKVTDTKVEAAFIGNTSKKKSITIPATIKYANQVITITSVAKNALKNNKIITSITIGKNVTSIGANAFSGCKKLKNITLKTTKLKSFGKNCVKNIYKKATIKCPKSSKKNYKAKLTKKTGFTGQMKLK